MAYKILTFITQCDQHGSFENHLLVDETTTFDQLFAEMQDEESEGALTLAIFYDSALAEKTAELLNKAGLN